MADRKISQRGLARAMGVDPAAMSLMLRGRREMKIAEAVEIARILGVSADEVMENAGVRLNSSHKQVGVVAWIDADGESHLASDDPRMTLPHPGGGIPLNVNAIVCRTAGGPLDHMDGWVLFSEDIRAGVPAEAIGRLSICKIANGIAFLAKVTRSPQRGRWNLIGPAATISNVELEWALPVLLIQT